MTGFNTVMELAIRTDAFSSGSIQETLDLINNQIQYPFTSDSHNHIKQLKQIVANADELDEYCADMLRNFSNSYLGLSIDAEDYDGHLCPIVESLYRIFARKPGKYIRSFILYYILDNGNRKRLIVPLLSETQGDYHQDSYGTRENFILINKLGKIIEEIFDDQTADGISLEEYLMYLARAGKAQPDLKRFIDEYIISDRGVIRSLYEKYRDSRQLNRDISWLQVEIYKGIVKPYLQKNGFSDAVSIPLINQDNDGDDGFD